AGVASRSEVDGLRAATMLPSSASSPGQAGMYGLKDFILDQVERHWNLNLANLKDADYSVPARVKITKTGEVLNAELIGDSRSGDPHYDEVAISARNAVLASSPLALPAGQYDDVIEATPRTSPTAVVGPSRRRRARASAARDPSRHSYAPLLQSAHVGASGRTRERRRRV